MNPTHLPNELLQLIGSYVQLSSFSSPIFRESLQIAEINLDDPQDSAVREFWDASYTLSAFSRVSCSTRQTIEPLLYRNVVVGTFNRYGRAKTCANVRLLLRTLQQRKGLAPYIQAVVVSRSDGDTHNSISKLLALCTRLDSLIARSITIWPVASDESKLSVCTTLRQLTIAYPRLSVDHLFHLFPNLSNLEISACGDPRNVIPSHKSRLLLPSPLRVLRFTAFPRDIELGQILSRVINHFGGTLSNLYLRFGLFQLFPPIVHEQPLPKYKPKGDALRILHFDLCLFSKIFPHTPHILRDLHGLQHFKITFCIPLTPADFQRMPMSLRSLTLCDFGHVLPDNGPWGSYTPPLDEKGFIESLLICLSSREVQPRCLSAIAILEGTPNEKYRFKTPDFNPLRIFCEENGLEFHERLQVEQDDDVVGRGIIQVLFA